MLNLPLLTDNGLVKVIQMWLLTCYLKLLATIM